MAGPSNIFVGLSQSDLDALRSNALLRIANGDRTSLSGGAKSGSKRWSMDADEVLRAVVYAEQANGTRPARAQKVSQILTCGYLGRRYLSE